MKSIVPDTGVLIDGRISELVKHAREETEVVIANSSLAELEHQANAGKEIGFAGLNEIKKLHELAKQGKVSLHFEGERPDAYEIESARFGGIDAKIRKLAKDLKATLWTTDRVQAEVAEAEGIAVEYLKPIVSEAKVSFERFFSDKNTMSVHLKENCPPKAKIGLPGEFQLVDLEEKAISGDAIEKMVQEAVEGSAREENSFIEIDKQGATVIQLGDYRIVYTRAPFSEARELTIVRPIAKLTIDDYHLNSVLFERLKAKAEGVLVAGPPGSGKSTFVTALAEYYAAQKKIVKTLEQPRDLQVGKEITQYSPLEGSFAQAADVLLLVRPDYTVFDEVRKLDDFKTFADLRMAGIGMLGVVHASKAIDAIQRFIGKIDLGIIPQVIDTIIFLQKGRIAKVYELQFTVKVPAGMREQDLARPIIEVRDFLTHEPEFQIYKWGEEAIVYPLAARANREEGSATGRGFDGGAGRDRRDRFDRGARGGRGGHGGRGRRFAENPQVRTAPTLPAASLPAEPKPVSPALQRQERPLPAPSAGTPLPSFMDDYKITRILNAELDTFAFKVHGDKIELSVPERQLKELRGNAQKLSKLERKLGMGIDLRGAAR